MDIFNNLLIVMVSWIYTHTQIDLYTKLITWHTLCVTSGMTIIAYQKVIIFIYPVQFSSVTKPCPTLCDPMDHSTPGLLVHHQLSESTQTHVHRVSDAIQSSHPLSSPFPPALNLSQHQGLFK